MAYDVEQHRGGIDYSIYCGACGYNLRTLPWVGRCPECGNEYIARPTRRKGTFLPQELVFPWGDLFTAFAFLLLAAGSVSTLLLQRPLSRLVIGMAVVAWVAAGYSTHVAWRNLARYVRFRNVGRDEETED